MGGTSARNGLSEAWHSMQGVRSGLAVLRAARPPFLVLSPICVLLGAAAAHHAGAQVVGGDLVLAVVGALAAHAAVNLLNEYHDACAGIDARTVRTPFSGGSGALQDCPEALHAVRAAGGAGLALTMAIGAWLVAHRGPAVLPAGLLGVALVLAYTPYANRHPWLCLISPGLGVGLAMVLGSELVLAGRISAGGVAAALLTGLLGSNLLLGNQFPDIDADRAGGRRHVLIVYGAARGAQIYGGVLALAVTSLLLAVGAGALPVVALAAGLPLACGARAWRGLRAFNRSPTPLAPYLACSVVAAVATPAVLALALWSA